MASQLLYLLELVAIPVLNHTIFAGTEKVMAVTVLIVRNKCDLHDTILMSKESFMTITKIETPYPDIFVGRTSHD